MTRRPAVMWAFVVGGVLGALFGSMMVAFLDHVAQYVTSVRSLEVTSGFEASSWPGYVWDTRLTDRHGGKEFRVLMPSPSDPALAVTPWEVEVTSYDGPDPQTVCLSPDGGPWFWLDGGGASLKACFAATYVEVVP